MRKETFSRRSVPSVLLLLTAACAVPGCGSDDAPSEDLGARLASDTGVAWGVVVDPDRALPRPTPAPSSRATASNSALRGTISACT